MNREPSFDQRETFLRQSRRELFQGAAAGVAGVALASLLHQDSEAAPASATDDPMRVREPHFPAKAKSVIFIHMVGGPSHLDLFAPKPVLNKHSGQPVPQKYIEGQQFAFIRGTPKLLGSKYQFAKHGECGHEFSELLPHLAGVADDLAFCKSVQTELINHAPAQLFMQTGFARFGRPCVGAWTTYGLGSESKNLPGFVVLNSGKLAGAGSSLWGSGFLPTVYQGIEFRTQGEPVLYLSNPAGVSREKRRRMVSDINALNEMQLADVGDPEIATRISQYELGFRMQASVPDLADVSQETAETLKAYGASKGGGSFANNCLLARRLVERGVRFVQLYDEGWDTHSNLDSGLRKKCKQVDQPIAALIRDLKQRGLLDSTLVIWSSEFGRTPMLQGGKDGRDHHKDAFCTWMAGAGVKGGASYGKTDELGYYPTEEAMNVHDFHATILHLLGIDHTKLTFKFQGRPYRLTDVHGEVVHKILA